MDSTVLIISKVDMATAAKTFNRVSRANHALSRGGSFDLVTLAGQPPIAVVADPSKLTDAERAEITATVEQARAIAASLKEEAAASPEIPTPEATQGSQAAAATGAAAAPSATTAAPPLPPPSTPPADTPK